MDVRVSKNLPGPEWDAFVDAQPAATFAHKTAWYRAVKDGMGRDTHFIEVRDGGAIVGILGLVEIKSFLFGHSLAANGFCVYGGPVATSPEAHAALDAAAREVGLKAGADHVEYRDQDRLRPDWPAESERYCTFRRDMPEAADDILTWIPRKQRAEVRKALDHGLEADHAGDVDLFYDLLARSWRKLGTPILSRRFFHALKAHYGDDCEIMIVKSEGKPVASLLSFYFKDQVLPYYAGSDDRARAASAHHFMYYALMMHAHGRGARMFDFGRSKTGTGPFSFKKGFGFEPAPLHNEYMLLKADELPQVNPNNPKYKLFIETWQCLPLWLANMAGPLVSRDLG